MRLPLLHCAAACWPLILSAPDGRNLVLLIRPVTRWASNVSPPTVDKNKVGFSQSCLGAVWRGAAGVEARLHAGAQHLRLWCHGMRLRAPRTPIDWKSPPRTQTREHLLCPAYTYNCLLPQGLLVVRKVDGAQKCGEAHDATYCQPQLSSAHVMPARLAC
jgi:hypothetical protein